MEEDPEHPMSEQNEAFLWRFWHNIHPLLMNLKRRGMELDTRCVVCHRFNDEDGAHLFFICKTMEKVWSYLGISWESYLLLMKSSAREALEAVMAMKEEQLWLC